MKTHSQSLSVLLIDDDEDDHVLIRDMLSDVIRPRFKVNWASGYGTGLEELRSGRHDICLLDYQLGGQTGLGLLREAMQNGCATPIILLTGREDYTTDIEAMEAGAVDYLIKDHVNSTLLERSIRYALDRRLKERALRELSARILTAQEEERKRIAHELHDSIGASLSAIKYRIENAHIGMLAGAASPESLSSVISLVQQTIDEARRLMSDLHPPMLDDLGILPTVNWLARQFQDVYTHISIEKAITIEEDEVPEGLKIVIFRILQEALHNIAKYSKADLVRLVLTHEDGVITLTVQDNGTGFDVDAVRSKFNPKRGFGLSTMRERAEFSGGRFAIKSSPGRGTTVRAVWSTLSIRC
jgi:signal transduction histidine kinase